MISVGSSLTFMEYAVASSNAINNVGTVLGFTDLAITGRGFMEAEYIRQATINATLASKNISSIPNSISKISTAGRVVGVAGLGLTVTDMALNGVNRRNSLDLTMGGFSIIPKVGWLIGGTYFMTNFVLGLSGKHVADYLPNSTP